jgi:hypothetical protein
VEEGGERNTNELFTGIADEVAQGMVRVGDAVTVVDERDAERG